MEKTFVLLKPEALKRNLIGEIIKRIELKGLKIVELRTISLDEDLLKEHYAHIVDKPYFVDVKENMLSGPVLAMIVEGENAVEAMMILCGPTQWNECAPGTIRGDLSTNTTYNMIHRSDSKETALIEIKRFFGKTL